MNGVIKTLKSARTVKKIKQSELGSMLGLPQGHISKIEQGITDPRLSTVADMARLLDQELVLVPRAMLPAVRAFIKGGDAQQPLWAPDDGEGDE